MLLLINSVQSTPPEIGRSGVALGSMSWSCVFCFVVVCALDCGLLVCCVSSIVAVCCVSCVVFVWGGVECLWL